MTDMNKSISEKKIEQMIDAALKARKLAYTPYSHYMVGAALLVCDGTEDNKIITGCNIENAAYSPGNCAERTAIFKAVSEGCRDMLAIAIVAGNEAMTDEDIAAADTYVSPCGMCRQVLREFVNPADFVVIMAKSKTDYRKMTLEELFPYGFGPEYIKY